MDCTILAYSAISGRANQKGRPNGKGGPTVPPTKRSMARKRPLAALQESAPESPRRHPRDQVVGLSPLWARSVAGHWRSKIYLGRKRIRDTSRAFPSNIFSEIFTADRLTPNGFLTQLPTSRAAHVRRDPSALLYSSRAAPESGGQVLRHHRGALDRCGCHNAPHTLPLGGATVLREGGALPRPSTQKEKEDVQKAEKVIKKKRSWSQKCGTC